MIDGRDAAFFAERFARAGNACWSSLAHEEPIGFLLMTDGHIDMLFMDPRCRRQRRRFASPGRGGGRGAKSLECFRDNHGARRFYERHGWRMTREYERDFAGKSRSFVFYEKG